MNLTKVGWLIFIVVEQIALHSTAVDDHFKRRQKWTKKNKCCNICYRRRLLLFKRCIARHTMTRQQPYDPRFFSTSVHDIWWIQVHKSLHMNLMKALSDHLLLISINGSRNCTTPSFLVIGKIQRCLFVDFRHFCSSSCGTIYDETNKQCKVKWILVLPYVHTLPHRFHTFSRNLKIFLVILKYVSRFKWIPFSVSACFRLYRPNKCINDK